MSVLLLLFTSSSAKACTEFAVMRDMDSFATSWSSGKFTIKMWESPGMVRMVGTLRPGTLVKVLGRSQGYLKVKAADEDGGYIGWVSQAVVEMTFPEPQDEFQECDDAVMVYAPVKKENRLSFNDNEGEVGVVK